MACTHTKILKRHTYIILLITISACQEKVSSLAEYQTYLHKNSSRFIQIQETELFKFTLQYLPPSYQAMQVLEAEGHLTTDRLDTLTTSYAKTLAFQLLIEAKDKRQNLRQLIHREVGELADYAEQVSTLNFHLPKNIFLLGKKARLSPLHLSLESTIDSHQQLRFLILFTKPLELSQEDELIILLEDLFFQPGTYKFKYSQSALNYLPQLDLS